MCKHIHVVFRFKFPLSQPINSTTEDDSDFDNDLFIDEQNETTDDEINI